MKAKYGFDGANMYPPATVNWVRDIMDFPGVSVYTDNMLFSGAAKDSLAKYKVGWLMESTSVTPWAYEHVHRVEDDFDFILTHARDLVSHNPEKYVWSPWGNTWIRPSERIIYEKSKMISMIASSKNFTEGHKHRHDVVKNFKDDLDLMGRGYKEIASKSEGLKDYRYSVAIENCKIDGYFTEKLIDCFLQGTIPIYWGDPRIGDIFDLAGMYVYDTLDDLRDILNNISNGDYESKKESIQTNHRLAKQFICVDDVAVSKIVNKIRQEAQKE
jgi:hypothetical protein